MSLNQVERWVREQDIHSSVMQQRRRCSQMQRRAAVQNGTQIQLNRAFSAGQLIYTTPVSIENQTLNVQVDTGSSDLVSVIQ